MLSEGIRVVEEIMSIAEKGLVPLEVRGNEVFVKGTDIKVDDESLKKRFGNKEVVIKFYSGIETVVQELPSQTILSRLTLTKNGMSVRKGWQEEPILRIDEKSVLISNDLLDGKVTCDESTTIGKILKTVVESPSKARELYFNGVMPRVQRIIDSMPGIGVGALGRHGFIVFDGCEEYKNVIEPKVNSLESSFFNKFIFVKGDDLEYMDIDVMGIKVYYRGGHTKVSLWIFDGIKDSAIKKLRTLTELSLLLPMNPRLKQVLSAIKSVVEELSKGEDTHVAEINLKTTISDGSAGEKTEMELTVSGDLSDDSTYEDFSVILKSGEEDRISIRREKGRQTTLTLVNGRPRYKSLREPLSESEMDVIRMADSIATACGYSRSIYSAVEGYFERESKIFGG